MNLSDPPGPGEITDIGRYLRQGIRANWKLRELQIKFPILPWSFRVSGHQLPPILLAEFDVQWYQDDYP